ncbi:MAG: hypothetical protein GTO63_23625 [Anaerolineae bacterium]|nr:hypothetical protein [Anaerolineae bacterium]NIN97715.1 hypothetical protein [Anaerolineae bacterium]
MMKLIHSMYDYSAWANKRILDASAPLSPEQLLAGGGASFDSLRDTLVHIMSGQWIWLSRWQGTSPKTMFKAGDFPDLTSIRDRWDAIEEDTRQFLVELNSDQLSEVITYVSTQGESWAYPLWQQMVHQVNHATQHRSEAAVMLTHFGHSPGLLDLLHYFDLLNAEK